MEDKTLLEDFLKGNINSFEMLMNKYKDMALSFAYFHTKNYSDASDIAQEVFIRLYTKARTIKDASKLKSWLYKTEINLINDHFRAKKRRSIIDYESYNEIIKHAADDYDYSDKIALFDAIERLNKNEKDLVYLKYLNGLTIKEISSIINKSENNIKVMLHRTREKLARMLEGEKNEENGKTKN
jgi:RNA polymerase sigma-70 factor, ECF subfamily